LIRAVSLGYVYIIAKMGLNAKVIVLKIKKKPRIRALIADIY
jgi:hypothetical protein